MVLSASGAAFAFISIDISTLREGPSYSILALPPGAEFWRIFQTEAASKGGGNTAWAFLAALSATVIAYTLA